VISEEFRQAWPFIRDTEGFLPKPDAAFLFKAARELEYKDGVIVEIGAYKGRSAVCLSLATKSYIYSVDTFTDFAGRDGTLFTNNVTNFLTSLNKIKAQNMVTPMIMTSELAREQWDWGVPKPIKLLFIDGNHDYEFVKKDYELWSPLVVPGGWVLFHDYSPDWPGVVKFVDELNIKNLVKFGAVAGFKKE